MGICPRLVLVAAREIGADVAVCHPRRVEVGINDEYKK